MSPLCCGLAILQYLFYFILYLILRLVLMLAFLLALLKLYLGFVKGKCKCTARLEGKTAVITGGSSGIGLETARELARRGARVLIASRDREKAERACEDIVASTGNRNVHYRHLDLADLSSVRSCARRLAATERTVDILVNNAGAAGIARRRTVDGLDVVMQINHFGHFLLTNLLLEKLAASAPSRIVTVTSLAHRWAKLNATDLNSEGCGHFARYANSKLCNVLFARALASRLPPGVVVNSAHPGVVYTDIFRRLPDPWRELILGVVRAFFKTAKEGAQTSIHLCLVPEADVSGRYWADCRLARESASGRDSALAERVWTASARLTGLSRSD